VDIQSLTHASIRHDQRLDRLQCHWDEERVDQHQLKKYLSWLRLGVKRTMMVATMQRLAVMVQLRLIPMQAMCYRSLCAVQATVMNDDE